MEGVVVAGPLIVACIGSSDPVLREYVHDFGLCAINLTMVEEALRSHLEHRDVLEAKWHLKDGTKGMKVKKHFEIKDRYAMVTLGGLVTKYERNGGKPELVAVLRPVADGRNVLLHNHLQLTDYETMQMPVSRIQEVRAALHQLSEQAQTATTAIQVADIDVFEMIINRIKREGIPRNPFAVPLEHMLAAFERTVRKTSVA